MSKNKITKIQKRKRRIRRITKNYGLKGMYCGIEIRYVYGLKYENTLWLDYNRWLDAIQSPKKLRNILETFTFGGVEISRVLVQGHEIDAKSLDDIRKHILIIELSGLWSRSGK